VLLSATGFYVASGHNVTSCLIALYKCPYWLTVRGSKECLHFWVDSWSESKTRTEVGYCKNCIILHLNLQNFPIETLGHSYRNFVTNYVWARDFSYLMYTVNGCRKSRIGKVWTNLLTGRLDSSHAPEYIRQQLFACIGRKPWPLPRSTSNEPVPGLLGMSISMFSLDDLFYVFLQLASILLPKRLDVENKRSFMKIQSNVILRDW